MANNIAKKNGKIVKAHLKIDTGMGRHGFLYSEGEKIVKCLKMLNNIEIEGMFSHFSLAFADNTKWTNIQFERFLKVVECLKKNKIEIKCLHICNTSAFLRFRHMHLNAARIGAGFVGRISIIEKHGLIPVGKLEAEVSEIKELPKGYNIGYGNLYKTKKNTKIAITQVGYIDGIGMECKEQLYKILPKLRIVYNSIKNIVRNKNLTVEINGEKCNVLGQIAMCNIIIDITGKDIKVGDKVKFNVKPLYIDRNIRREFI